MSSAQILQAKKSKGVSFHFKFPKTGLSLRSVVIEDDGLPKLIFDGANCRELPTLTEEDFATVARVVAEGKRPEFFYTGFLNPCHPFSNFGRLYKLYSPQWLRGTSIGELLSEADWLMKCLHVGTRSNKTKTEFWSWQKTSKLDNLAVHMDFPCESEKSNRRVLMGCDSVKMEQSDNEILFVGEPNMKITDESSPMYSKYITEYYDNVAYYDEPLFLKMQELIKLIVAIEWMMKEKGIVFNKKWLSYHTEKKKLLLSQALQPIEVENTDEIFQHVIDSCKTKMKELHGVDPYSLVSSAKIELTKRTPTGIEFKGTGKCPLSSLEEVTTIRMSFNDYNFLYEWFDCREPFTFNEDGKPIIPDVTSWSELYAETVPVPCTIGIDNEGIFTESGGITTRDIPVRKVKREKSATQESVTVKASNKSQPLVKTETLPQRSNPSKPKTNIPSNTLEAKYNQDRMSETMHGIRSSTLCSMQSNSGRRTQVQPILMVGKRQLKPAGQTVSEEQQPTMPSSNAQPPTNTSISPLLSTDNGVGSIEHQQIPPLQQPPTIAAPNIPPTSSTGCGIENIEQPQLEPQNVPANTPISPPLSPTSTDSGLGNIGQQNPPQLELQPQNVPANTPISPPWSPTSTDSGFGDIGQQNLPQLELKPQNVHANTPINPPLSPTSTDSGFGDIGQQNLPLLELKPQNVPANTPINPPWSPTSTDSGFRDIGQQNPPAAQLELQQLQPQNVPAITPDSPPLSPDSGLGSDEPIEEQYMMNALDDIVLGSPKIQSDSSDKDDNSDNKDMD